MKTQNGTTPIGKRSMSNILFAQNTTHHVQLRCEKHPLLSAAKLLYAKHTHLNGTHIKKQQRDIAVALPISNGNSLIARILLKPTLKNIIYGDRPHKVRIASLMPIPNRICHIINVRECSRLRCFTHYGVAPPAQIS